MLLYLLSTKVVELQQCHHNALIQILMRTFLISYDSGNLSTEQKSSSIIFDNRNFSCICLCNFLLKFIIIYYFFLFKNVLWFSYEFNTQIYRFNKSRRCNKIKCIVTNFCSIVAYTTTFSIIKASNCIFRQNPFFVSKFMYDPIMRSLSRLCSPTTYRNESKCKHDTSWGNNVRSNKLLWAMGSFVWMKYFISIHDMNLNRIQIISWLPSFESLLLASIIRETFNSSQKLL